MAVLSCGLLPPGNQIWWLLAFHVQIISEWHVFIPVGFGKKWLKYWVLKSFVFSWSLRHFSRRVFRDYRVLCLQVKRRISIRIATVLNIIARWCSQHHRPKVPASIFVEPLTIFGWRYEFLVNHITCKNREEWKEALLDVKDGIKLIICSFFVMVCVGIGAVVHHPTWSDTVTIVLSRFSKCRENERFLIERGLVQPLKKYLTAEYLALLHFFPNMHGNICN